MCVCVCKNMFKTLLYLSKSESLPRHQSVFEVQGEASNLCHPGPAAWKSQFSLCSEVRTVVCCVLGVRLRPFQTVAGYNCSVQSPGKDGKIVISNVARTVAGTVQEHFFFLWPLREGMSVHWYNEGHLI